MAKKLQGKVAVVTGASSGIGKTIVEKYAEEGAQIIASARNLGALKELEAAWPGQVKAVAGDVTKPEDLKRLVDEAVKAHGGVDIVVPNAGIARVVSFENSTAEAFNTQFSVNLFAAAETARLFIPHIRKGGSIQFITTFLTQVGFPGLAIYSASKAALKSLSQTLAAELAPQGIPSHRARSGRRCGERWGCRLKFWAWLRKRSMPGSCLVHSASRRTSPNSRCSWPRTVPRTSTARKSSWMAGIPSAERRCDFPALTRRWRDFYDRNRCRGAVTGVAYPVSVGRALWAGARGASTNDHAPRLAGCGQPDLTHSAITGRWRSGQDFPRWIALGDRFTAANLNPALARPGHYAQRPVMNSRLTAMLGMARRLAPDP